MLDEFSDVSTLVLKNPHIQVKEDKVDKEATKKFLTEKYDEATKLSVCDIINQLCVMDSNEPLEFYMKLPVHIQQNMDFTLAYKKLIVQRQDFQFLGQKYHIINFKDVSA